MPSALARPDEPEPARPGRLTSALVLVIWTAAILAQVAMFAYLLPVSRFRNPQGMDASLQMSELVTSAFALLMASLGVLIILRSANHRMGWLMLAAGALLAVGSLAAEYSKVALLMAPAANLPLGRLAAWVQDLWTIPTALIFFLLPVLFPDGKLPSRRWRVIVWPATAGWGLFILAFALAQRPLANAFLDVEAPPSNPLGILPGNPTLFNIAFAGLLAVSIVTGTASVISRWRGSTGEVRQQIKWVVYAFLLLLATAAVAVADALLRQAIGVDLGLERAIDVAMGLSLFGILAGLGMAVLKYRLYDIDLVINRTLVYGALTAIIVTTYVFIVAGLGALLPIENDLFLSLGAAGVIAVLFNPLRARLQRAANRLMFGWRDDPYAVLSDLGRLLSSSATPDATLQTVAETVASALKLPYVAIRLEGRGCFRTRAEHGTPAASQIELPLVHRNQVVGQLVVAPRSPSEALTPKDRQLLEDIAHQASAVAYAVRLTAELQRSRELLVLAREEERRRIRRDLHDGLGPSLASQTFRLDAALDLLQDDPQAAAQVLESLKAQNQRLVADIRRLVHGLRPEALDELGLPGALSAHAGQLENANRLHITILTKPDPLPALPAAVEVAAYRIALEAITNVVRHAHARACRVELEAEDSRLVLSVSDDGVGLPPETGPGVGLTSMHQRAEELGGWIEVAAGQPDGTRVTAVLPMGGSNEGSRQAALEESPGVMSVEGEGPPWPEEQGKT